MFATKDEAEPTRTEMNRIHIFKMWPYRPTTKKAAVKKGARGVEIRIGYASMGCAICRTRWKRSRFSPTQLVLANRAISTRL